MYFFPICQACSLYQSLNSSSGSFGTSEYTSNLDCTWFISLPDLSKKVNLSFSFFQTECNYDEVSIFNVHDSNSLIATLSGSNPIPWILSNSSKMIIKFTSDSSIQSRGFLATYSSVQSQIQNFDSFHSADMVLDPQQKSLLLSGGRNISLALIPKLKKYNLSTNSWSNVLLNIDSLYDHTVFLIDSKTYVYTHELLQLVGTNFVKIESESPPPRLKYPIVVPAPTEKKVFVLGGWTEKLIPSRLVFCFNFADLKWTELTPIYTQKLSDKVTKLNAFYRPSSQFIHVFCPVYLYSYHVPSNLWYKEKYSNFDDVFSVLSPSVTLLSNGSLVPEADAFFAVYGGKYLYSQENRFKCYSEKAYKIDLDCWTMQSVSIPYSARMSHSAAQVNGTVFFAGGYNGIDLNDFFSIDFHNFSTNRRLGCMEESWCVRSNDCNDCLMKPNCGWCDEKCVYGCTSTTCPNRILLELGKQHSGFLKAGQTTTFRVFINDPFSDIFFVHEPENVVFYLLNAPKRDYSIILPSPIAWISPQSPIVFGGWYILRAENKGEKDETYSILVKLKNPSSDRFNEDLAKAVLTLSFASMCLLLASYIVIRRFIEARAAHREIQQNIPEKIAPIYIIKSKDLSEIRKRFFEKVSGSYQFYTV